MRKVWPVVIVCLGALAGCAGSNDDATSTITTMDTTGVPVGSTSAEPTIRTVHDPTVRTTVLTLRNEADQKYAAEVAALKTMGILPENIPDDERIDDSIIGACESEARGFRPSQEMISFTETFLAKALANNGHDVKGFLEDLMERDRKIAGVVGCWNDNESR